MQKNLILLLIILLPFASAATNVKHTLDGTTLRLTYDGVPPFAINIRTDNAIGQPGGYLWAITSSSSFLYDLGFAINPSEKFYLGVRDSKGWSESTTFFLNNRYGCIKYDLCKAEDVLLFADQYCKPEVVQGISYCRVLGQGVDQDYFCRSRCIRVFDDRQYENIYTSPFVTWYLEATPQLSQEQRELFIHESIFRNFDIVDRLYVILNNAFGDYEDRRYYIELTNKEENRGVFWTPTSFGGGMGMHYQSQESRTVYDLTLHEFINSFAGYAGGIFPTDWWVNHKSPFPAAVKPFVLDRMGIHEEAERLRQEAGNAGWEDYSQYLFFRELIEEQGLELIKRMFLAMKEDNIKELADSTGNPSIILSHYTAAYLSYAAGRNLADEMNARLLGQFVPPNTIPKYTFNEQMIDDILITRNKINQLKEIVMNSQGHERIRDASGLLEDAWIRYRKGNYGEALEKANQGLAIFTP